jgi:hypothetical protein
VEENHVASLFDNDDDVLFEPVQESGDVDDNSDVDMIPTELHSRRSSMSEHNSVPPTTDSDRDIAMPDKDDSEPEADQSYHRQSVCEKFYDLKILNL